MHEERKKYSDAIFIYYVLIKLSSKKIDISIYNKPIVIGFWLQGCNVWVTNTLHSVISLLFTAVRKVDLLRSNDLVKVR